LTGYTYLIFVKDIVYSEGRTTGGIIDTNRKDRRSIR